MLTKRVKTAVIKDSARHPEDTGSADVQVAILTRKITELTAHLKKNKKDFHSRRGLLQMVADRRTHLRYLEKNDKPRNRAVHNKRGPNMTKTAHHRVRDFRFKQVLEYIQGSSEPHYNLF